MLDNIASHSRLTIVQNGKVRESFVQPFRMTQHTFQTHGPSNKPMALTYAESSCDPRFERWVEEGTVRVSFVSGDTTPCRTIGVTLEAGGGILCGF